MILILSGTGITRMVTLFWSTIFNSLIVFAMIGYGYYYQQMLTATIIKLSLDKVEARVLDDNPYTWQVQQRSQAQ